MGTYVSNRGDAIYFNKRGGVKVLKKETSSVTKLGPRERGGVLVTDFSDGGSVTTRTSPGGQIVSQEFAASPKGSRGGGITQDQAIAAANRAGGLVSQQVASGQQVQSINQQRLEARQQSPRVENAFALREFKDDVPQRELFFKDGEQVGEIQLNRQGQPISASSNDGGTFVTRTDNRVRQVTFNESGAEILERAQVDVPALSFDGAISDINQGTTQEQRLSEIEQRRQLPPLQRLRLAYTSVPGSAGISARGGIRAFLEGTDIVFAPVIEKLNIPQGPAVSSRVAEDIAIGGLFLGPTTATTAQIERQLFEVGKVQQLGITRQVTPSRARTDAVFSASRAARTVRGGVQAESVNLAKTDSLSLVATGARGQTVSRGLRFPTATEVVKRGGAFSSAELAVVKQRANVFAGLSRGILRQGRTQKNFVSANLGVRQGDFIAQVGATESSGAPSASAGLFRVTSRSPSTNFEVLSSAIPKTPNLNQISRVTTPTTSAEQAASASAVQSAIRSATRIEPAQPINLNPTSTIPSSRTQTGGAQITQRTDAPVTSIQVPRQQPIQNINQGQASSSALRQVSTGRNRQEERTLLQTRQIQIPQQTQTPLSIQRTLQLQRQTQRATTINPQIPIPRIPTEPIVPLSNFRGRQSRRQSIRFPVLVRRFGKFKTVGFGRTPGEAINIGREVTGRTLARTFTIPGLSPFRVRGFRTKTTRQGTLFIEPSSRALSTKTELGEIKFFRQRRGGRRR